MTARATITPVGSTATALTGVVYASDSGVSPANTAVANDAALQTAIDAARAAAQAHGFRNGTVILPSGVILIGGTKTSAFVLGATGAGPAVCLVGQGRLDTDLSWSQTRDAGLGNYAFDGTNTSFRFTLLRNLTVSGPGVSANRLGLPPGRSGGGYVGMHGVLLQSGLLENIRVQNFNYGITVLNDHNRLIEVQSGSNYVGLFIDSTGAIANNGYDRVELTGNMLASVACSKASGLLADDWNNCHLGFSPFGIYQMNTDNTKNDPSNSNFMNNSSLTSIAIESCGHAMILSEDRSGSCYGTALHSCTSYSIPDTNFRIPTISITGAATLSGSDIITCTSTNGLNVGMPVVGTGIPSGAMIRSITDATHFRLYQNATATNSGLTLTVDYRTDYAISVGNWSAMRMYATPDWYTNNAGTDGIIEVGSGGGFRQNLADNCQLGSVMALTLLGRVRLTNSTTTAGSAVVTCDSTAKVRVGDTVNGPNMSNGKVVQSIDSSTQITLTTNAAGNGSAQTLVIRRAGIQESAGPTNWFFGGDHQEGTLELAGADITSGQLLQYGGSGSFWCVQPYIHGGTAKCIGVAANTCKQGEIVGVYKRGTATGIADGGFVNSGNGTPLKPSTTTDGAFTNGTFGTDQIIGFTRNGSVMVLNV